MTYGEKGCFLCSPEQEFPNPAFFFFFGLVILFGLMAYKQNWRLVGFDSSTDVKLF